LAHEIENNTFGDGKCTKTLLKIVSKRVNCNAGSLNLSTTGILSWIIALGEREI